MLLQVHVQVNGTQLVAGYYDGTVITSSYTKGEILFQVSNEGA